ncbi:MAG: nuclease-related domain-containing protein [Armatimonadota bacterium]|nr:nuclease-related domain-containing protein [Armatimonadota bacterium]MDR7422058.1 nuclease-related domain-containing protein [Armatimonadota bacterium]MDR7496022.1 nuclease-related domain-containing protein [Armatimonadota bacterium]
MAGAVLLTLVLVSNSRALGIGGFGILGLLFLARLAMDYMEGKANRMMKEERRAIRGAKAEEKIGSLLEGLGEDYLVIHDITSPYGNIDHIVISKQAGVFLVETKAHGGRVSIANGRLLVNGHEPEKNFIAQALKNTYWLRDKIQNAINAEIWITPVVVFTNAFVERTTPVKGVTIINKKYLTRILQRPSTRAQNLSVWEKRERIQEVLYASD